MLLSDRYIGCCVSFCSRVPYKECKFVIQERIESVKLIAIEVFS